MHIYLTDGRLKNYIAYVHDAPERCERSGFYSHGRWKFLSVYSSRKISTCNGTHS